MPTVFLSFWHVDATLRNQLETQLSMLKRQNVIETWRDRKVGAGDDFAREIDEHINKDETILPAAVVLGFGEQKRVLWRSHSEPNETK